jgi:hypothetical protein
MCHGLTACDEVMLKMAEGGWCQEEGVAVICRRGESNSGIEQKLYFFSVR